MNIYTDGSNIPGSGGWAFKVENVDYQEHGRVEEETTNNRMEMTACIKALEYAITVTKEVYIITDSRYLINGAMRNHKRNVNHDLWEQIDKLMNEFDIIGFRWVKGHNKDPNNELVDYLAKLQKG